MARKLTLVLTAGAIAALAAASITFADPAAPTTPGIKPNGEGASANSASGPSVPMTNAASAVPPPPNDYFKEYGHIIATTTEAAHPLKLTPPSTEVGEIRVPTDEEMSMRVKLEVLASLSDADIRARLEQWPAYGKMTLSDEGQFLARIQMFKDQRSKLALASARQNGLTLTPEQQVKYEKDYWDQRLALDASLVKQLGPVVRAGEQKMQENLFREFSTATPPPGKPAPKPAAVADSKPTQ